MYAVDRHRLIDGEKTICNGPHTVNKDDNKWQYGCLFTVLAYHRSLCSYVRICAVRRNNLYVCTVGQLVSFFFVAKDVHIKKKFLFEENERDGEKNRHACLKQMDK